MRRGGGYNNQSGSLLHNGPPHGPHQNQAQQQQQQQQQQNGRMGPNRMYHHQQQPHHHQAQHHHQQNLATLQTLQNLQNLQNQQQQQQQQQQQPPQMGPYGGGGHGHGHTATSPRPLSSFPSPPLSSTNNLTSLSLNSNHPQYPGSGSGGGGVSSNLLSLSSNGGGGGLNPSSSAISGPVVVGGDMPPVETVVARLETACRLLHGIGGNHTRVNEIGVEIQILSEDLRRVGPLLETAYPDVLDRVMSSMRDASAQPTLPPSLRLAIFELVELRASKWMLPSDSSNYYRQRRNINDSVDHLPPDGPINHHHHYSSCNNSQSNSASGNTTATGRAVAVGVACNSLPKPEVMFQSDMSPPMGSSPIPSNSTTSSNSAKAYREEVLIKNSDSGKVAPSAKERVLSINGYSQQSINMAKQLIQETIQRNSSPVFDGLVSGTGPGSEYSGGDGEELDPGGVVSGLKKLGTSTKGDDVLQRFCYSVNLGDDILRISGSNLQFVQEAKFSLDDYFSQKYPELFYASSVDVEEADEDEEILDEVQLVPKYDRTTLLSLSAVKSSMPNFYHLSPEVRTAIVLERPRSFDPEKFCRDVNQW